MVPGLTVLECSEPPQPVQSAAAAAPGALRPVPRPRPERRTEQRRNGRGIPAAAFEGGRVTVENCPDRVGAAWLAAQPFPGAGLASARATPPSAVSPCCRPPLHTGVTGVSHDAFVFFPLCGAQDFSSGRGTAFL